MKSLIEFVKDKSYYFLGGTVLLVILLVIIGVCSNSNGSGYVGIENKMVKAATEYYGKKTNLLPKQDGGVVKVTIASLIESELLKEIKDPNNKSNICSGYVEVTKIKKEYSYIPFLTCKGSYEPEYLTEKVKNVKSDEYGNGVYTIGNELVYRGAEVNNFVSFNEQLWRIVKIDSVGDIKLVLANSLEDGYSWDAAYNSAADDTTGITTDYLKTNIRKVLVNYYEKNFSNDSKAKIVAKNLCVGKYASMDAYSTEKECSIIKENEKIGLLNASDFQSASLATGCTNLNNKECGNYNYLSTSKFYTWLLNSSSNTTYKAFYLYSLVDESYASSERTINPVIYLTNKAMIVEGKGTETKPYIIK